MPFKKGQNIGKDNYKFNPNKEHGVEVIPFEEARYIKTAKGDIIAKSDWKGQPYIDWGLTKKELED